MHFKTLVYRGFAIEEPKFSILKEYIQKALHAKTDIDEEAFFEHLSTLLNTAMPGFHFVGKGKAEALAQKVPETFVIANEQHNSREENRDSNNVYLSADNLEALRHLVRSYRSKVKCIYIDPPYNTGSREFVYEDTFCGKGFGTDTKKNAAKAVPAQSWTMFMYPRLLLAAELLRQDGMIFLSIDDHEQAHLKLICDDIFGASNFLGTFVVNATPNARDYGHIAKMHEYVLFYAKDASKTKSYLLKDESKKFKYKDDIGPFNIHPLYNSNEAFSKGNRPLLHYPFYLNPKKQSGDFYEIGLEKKDGWIEVFPPLSQKNRVPFVWRWGKKLSQKNLNNEIVGYKVQRGGAKGSYRIVQKMRHSSKRIRSILSNELESVTSRAGTKELEVLFGGKIFSFPKPLGLLKKIFSASTKDDDIICDFFSGSASTAEAILRLNAQDGGNRRYILVQLPEDLEKRYEGARKSDKPRLKRTIDFLCSLQRPALLDQIGLERIARVREHLSSQTGIANIPGVRHYCVQSKLQASPKERLCTWLVWDGHGFPVLNEGYKIGRYKVYRYGLFLYLVEPHLNAKTLQVLWEYYDKGEWVFDSLVAWSSCAQEQLLSRLVEQAQMRDIKAVVRP